MRNNADAYSVLMLLPRFKPCILNKVHAGDKGIEVRFLAVTRDPFLLSV
jgi:hypothetical protein